MNANNEDTMVRQIEKNLSNNINENLFLTGRVLENDDIDVMPLTVSRAEYIRQAREACLRQLSSARTYSKPNDIDNLLSPKLETEQQNGRKPKTRSLLHDNRSLEGIAGEEDSMQELASFRFLIIRTVCALLLFITIFIIDKFDMKIGDFTSAGIQEYITGKDMLQNLEDIVVTWIK